MLIHLWVYGRFHATEQSSFNEDQLTPKSEVFIPLYRNFAYHFFMI